MIYMRLGSGRTRLCGFHRWNVRGTAGRRLAGGQAGTIRLLLISVGLSAGRPHGRLHWTNCVRQYRRLHARGFGCSVQTPLLTEVAGRGEGAR